MSYETDSEFPTIVIDNGSDRIKAGFAGDDAPRMMMPSIIGRPRHPVSESLGEKYYVGEEVEPRRGILTCKYPIEHGIVCNWDDMELVWKHIFENELGVQADDHSVLLTQSPANPRHNKEKCAQIMFETFLVPAFYLGDTLQLGLAATGSHTGLSINIETGVTHLGAVYEGALLQYHFHRFKVGSRDITDYFFRKLGLEKYGSSIRDSFKMARSIKEQLGYVASDFDQELAKDPETIAKKYTLPDGRMIKVGQECFIGPEGIFDPFLLEQEFYGLQCFIQNAIRRLPDDLQDVMTGNIVLSGGGALCPGFVERLQKEVATLLPKHNVAVTLAPGGVSAVWNGGKKIANRACFPQMCMTKDEYDEHGPSLIWKKCF